MAAICLEGFINGLAKLICSDKLFLNNEEKGAGSVGHLQQGNIRLTFLTHLPEKRGGGRQGDFCQTGNPKKICRKMGWQGGKMGCNNSDYWELESSYECSFMQSKNTKLFPATSKAIKKLCGNSTYSVNFPQSRSF